MTRALAWMGRRWRWYVALVFLALVAGCCYFVRGALVAGDERRASRARIEASANEAKDLAREVRDQNMRIEDQNALIYRIATAIDNATSADAQRRQAANLADIITDLRRSIDCTAFYFNAERPTPCAEVDARLDALRRGVDPFARPTATTGAP